MLQMQQKEYILNVTYFCCICNKNMNGGCKSEICFLCHRHFHLNAGHFFNYSIQSRYFPFDALLVGLSKNIGLTVGSWEIILAIILIGCNSILTKQRPEFLGFITAFITGIGIDLWLFLLHNQLTPVAWYNQVVCFGVGLVVIGLGTATYLHTNFAPIPVDRLTLIIKS